MENKTNTKVKTDVNSNTNNITVVDLQAIVNSSAQVKALKETQAAKIK